MSCVPHVMYAVVFVENFAVALLRICMTKSNVRCCYQMCDGLVFLFLNCSFLNILAGFYFVMKFAMDLLLICKPKTWIQYCGGCICKLLRICIVYPHLFLLVNYAENHFAFA